ncbi:MAG: CHAT domain-containing protein, partial [Pseudomonadota bacterium]
MIETNNKKEPSPEKTKKNIEELLRERKKLDKVLQSEFSREVTLMFTDIVGSTSFFERRGDIEGRSMIQEHNDILFPIIQHHQGTIIKTVGDAVMASFLNPEEAVRSAIEIQRTLSERNKKETKEDQIRVRIGLNYGQGIVQEDDVFGDVVNVAARVESLAEADQVLVSKAIYDQVRRTEDILCRYYDSTQVKGKAEPLEVYRVVWGDEEVGVDKTRSGKYAVPARLRKVRKIFVLELSREHNKIKVSGYEKSAGEKRTVVHYEDAQISPAEIEQYCQEVNHLLNQANKQGKISKEILVRLQKVGQSLYDGLLTPKAKEQIASTEGEDLILNIDDQLVHIPWELLYDGKQFFCQRFSMGRLVKTRQAVEGIKIRQVERPLKMLILSDPRKDLPRSYEEGLTLMTEVDKEEGLITAIHKTGAIKIDEVKNSIRHYDVVHYAGHADYNIADPSKSGWLLSEGKFTSHEIKKSNGTAPMAALVFSNACYSGQTEEWKIDANFGEKIYGLANGFLLSGVQHYIGTFWEIQDEPGSFFALEFYRNLLKANTIGEAMRLARQSLIKKYGEETIVWASYMLYGDPTYRYFDITEEPVPERGEGLKAEEKPVPRPFPHKTLVGTVLGAVIIVGLLLGIYLRFSHDESRLTKDPIEKTYVKLKAGKIGEAEKEFTILSKASGQHGIRGSEGMAAVFFQKGDYQNAQELCQKILNDDPQNIYAHVILGNIFFNQGDLDEAIKAYESAAQAEHGASWQKAEAYNRLGR